MYRKNASKIILSASILIGLYLALIFISPQILNSKTFQKKLVNFVEQKFNYKIKYENLKVKITPTLKLSIFSDYIFFDMTNHKSKSKKSKDIKLNYIKNINVKKADIILNDKNSILLSNVEAIPNKNKTKITLQALIKSDRLNHDVIAGNQGYLELRGNKIYADNFSVELNKQPVILNGILGTDFKINAKDISATDAKEAFLFYMKSIKPDKNFIENFYDFKGLIDVDLAYNNKKLDGVVNLKDFSAKFNIFNLPLYFKNASFIFKDDKIISNEEGKFYIYPMKMNFEADDIFSKDRIVKGNLTSYAKSEISKLLPDVSINGQIDLNVDFKIQNQTPVVQYGAKIKEGSSIKYKNYSTGSIEGNRKISAQTTKKGNDLFIDNYNYVITDTNTQIVSGLGKLSRKDSMSKFNLDYVTCKTNGFAPVDIIGSLSNFVNSGYFKGEIKYDNNKNVLTGNFELQKTNYKNFYIDNAAINANEKEIEINAKGTFEKSPFNSSINLVNDFNKTIVINNLNLYLKQYKIKKSASSKPKINNKKLKQAVKQLAFEIKNAHLKLDKLTFKDVVLENIELIGSMKDNMVEFSMPEIHFAQGSLGAGGLYDIQYGSSYIDFYAEQINAASASLMVFGLKDQFKGLADASMHLRTYDNLSDIKAKSMFYIKDGALTKLGSSEFIINKNKKPLRFKLQDIINIDIKKMEALTSDIQGYFDIKNEKVENVEIYNQNKYLSLFLEGSYNIQSQNTEMTLWGRYNKDAQRGIRVLFIPLSWITKFVFKNENTKEIYKSKISKIPPVSSDTKQEEIVNVSVTGNINDSKNLKINLRAIK